MVKIGSVKLDIHKGEREFTNLSLSDPNVIKWLLAYRDKVDMNFGSQTEFDIYVAGNTGSVNQELIATYAQLDDLISRCNFDSRQHALINLISMGYTFKDIEDISLNTTAQNAKRRYKYICKTIADMNNYIWSVWVNKDILHTTMKTCTRCGSDLPVKDKFFGKDARKPDGMQSICKKCDSNRKKVLNNG